MLWQQVMRDLQANMPWQRLRMRLLLILQIMAVTLFSLSLSRPVWSGNTGGNHYVAVIDTSARMQAGDIKPSRMEAARNGLLDLIDNMRNEDTMTIIQAGYKPIVLVGPNGDKSLLKQTAEEIKVSNGKTDLAGAVQLAQVLLRDQNEDVGQIHIFSDYYPFGLDKEDNVIFHIVSGNGENSAIAHVGYEVTDKSISAISRIVNYGTEKSVTLELKVDDMLFNIKEVNLPEDDEVAVYWSDIPVSAQKIEVSISNEDNLMLDNTGIAVVSEDFKQKVLLATERNVFLERAVALREDIELIKANTEEIPKDTDFHLYIYDGMIPEKLPGNGHVMAFSPSPIEQLGLIVDGELQPARAVANHQSLYPDLLQYVEPEGYQIAKAVKMNVPDGFTALLSDEKENPLIIAGKQGGRKIVLFSFSLHESNLPLKADFPILMQNLINWMLPQDISFAGQVYAGESLELKSFPDTSRIIVISPSGREYDFDAYPEPMFYDTQDIGVYRIIHQSEKQTYTGSFVVSVPTDEVSNLRTAGEVPEGSRAIVETKTSPFQKDIWMIAGWTLLFLLLIEWWVYHYGA